MSKNNKKNVNNKNNGSTKITTTLHGYPMVGPFTPGGKDVWYCDHKSCKYTQHGVYRRYKIQNWRSSQFGKKFVLCDGCVRQYKKEKPITRSGTSNVNVHLTLNGGMGMMQQPMQYPQQYPPQYAVQPPQQYVNGQFVQQPPMVQPAVSYGNIPQPQAQAQYQQYQQYPPMQEMHQQPIQTQISMTGNGYIPQQPIPQPVQQQPQPVAKAVPAPANDNSDAPNGNAGIKIIKQGWMMKKGDFVKSWKKRYFVLKSNKTLNYYESDNAVMVKGSVSLIKVKKIKKKSKQSFEVHTPKRNWSFACRDEANRDAWVKAITEVAGMS